MSAIQPSTTAPTTEPVTTTTAQEATVDTVESQPEVTEGSASPAENTATDATTEAPKGMAVVESQPISEGVLAYKQPGLVK